MGNKLDMIEGNKTSDRFNIANQKQHWTMTRALSVSTQPVSHQGKPVTHTVIFQSNSHQVIGDGDGLHNLQIPTGRLGRRIPEETSAHHS